jgi:hypothetical protein
MSTIRSGELMSSALATAADPPPLYFVCYAREQKDFVEKVEAKLGARRRRGELELWRDVRNLDVWDKFTDVILAALTRAAGAIVVVSDMWQDSNYIQAKEWPAIEQRQQNDSWFKIFALAFEGLEDDSPLRERNFVNNVDDELLVDAPPPCATESSPIFPTRLVNTLDRFVNLQLTLPNPARPHPLSDAWSPRRV